MSRGAPDIVGLPRRAYVPGLRVGPRGALPVGLDGVARRAGGLGAPEAPDHWQGRRILSPSTTTSQSFGLLSGAGAAAVVAGLRTLGAGARAMEIR